MQKFLLGSSDIGDSIQEGINVVVTNNKLRNATYVDTLETAYKNELRKLNPYEVLFKDISIFDVQNPITGSLLSRVV